MVLAAGGGLLDGWGGMVNRSRRTAHVTTVHAAAATMPTHERRFNTVAGLLAATPAHKALAAFAATL